jgi:hypothetical protein
MAGISKLMNMGLLSIFGGGEEGSGAGGMGVMDLMKKPGGMSGMSLLDGTGNGGGLMSAIRKPGKMSGLSLLDGAGDDKADKSPFKNILGIGF